MVSSSPAGAVGDRHATSWFQLAACSFPGDGGAAGFEKFSFCDFMIIEMGTVADARSICQN